MRWATRARVAESARRLIRVIGRHSVRPVTATCAALLAIVALGLVLGCAPPTPGHGTGATGGVGATSVTAPTATGTAVPCPTAAGTGSAASAPQQQQRLAAAVVAVVGKVELVPCFDTAYTAADDTAMVTVTLAGYVPTTPAAIAAAQERTKLLCFQVQQAVWTRSGVALRAATVAIAGPYLDPYIGLTTAPYASVYLTARTAATFAWAQLSPDSAWGRYDATFLRPGFNPSDGQPTATSTP